ncbi:uncharacterized protein AB675_1573 [Cyphellophora attinorum]|uniref:Nuclear segregation protein BFR1 n=1 Tax=Cyphellophora attinorum TaxID=1664694 RepID=A0A0N1HPT1_9EURO|nr:uncharacterized protein AB675_1573 [Phialophora attinorum]KPI37316.1 hypothetical protein AB675_1573 [Phialophora attinorum]
MADDTATSAAPAGETKRPEKPDEAKYKAALAQAEKDHTSAQNAFKAAKQKWDDARSGGSSKDPNDRFSQIVEEQKSIRAKQAEHKASKGGQQDKLSKNDADMKKLMNEQKEMRSRSGFKSADEIDSKVKSLQANVDSGRMKVVDEKKTLDEIRNLNRQKKQFGEMDGLQKRIDQLKLENTELRKTFDNSEVRELSAKYDANQKELDEIKSARQSTKDSRDTIKADRDAAYNKQQEAYLAIRKLKDEHYAGLREYKEYNDKIYAAKRERQKAERDAYEKEKRRKVAEARLEDASAPAFYEELRAAESLIKHFDPSYTADEKTTDTSKFAASAERSVDDSKFKDMKVVKKEEEDFFVGGGGKKKKGKKTTSTKSTMNLSPDIIENCNKVGVDPPSSQADVPATIEKLKEKVAAWKKDQQSQTEKNIEKAKKEIEKLEADGANGTATEEAPAYTSA